jgi:hypothetical protein
MDKNPQALASEFLKCAAGVWIIYYVGDWFGASQYLPWISTIIICYLILSLATTSFFVFVDFKKKDATLSTRIAA